MGYFDKYNKQREQGTYQAPQQNATWRNAEQAIRQENPELYDAVQQQRLVNQWNNYVATQQRREQEAQEQAGMAATKDQRTTAQKRIDKLLGVDSSQVTGEKTDWWKLAKGTLYKGADQFSTSMAGGLNWLFGDAAEQLHTLGVQTINDIIGGVNSLTGANIKPVENKGNLLTNWYETLKESKAHNEKVFSANANTSKAAQIVDNFGTSFVAAVPMALEALMTAPYAAAKAGATATTAGLQYVSGLQAAKGMEAAGMMARQSASTLMQNPQFWSSYVQAIGDSAENAEESGMSPRDAAIYTMINSFFNAVIEVGGADETLGGIQNFPMRLRQLEEQGGKKAVVEWFKDSVLGEGMEEVAQGIFERGVKAPATGAKVASLDPGDTEAVFNPWTSAQEFTGGAVVGGLLGGGQTVVQGGVQKINDNRAFKGDAQTLLDSAKQSGGEQYAAQIREIEQAAKGKDGSVKLNRGQARHLYDIIESSGAAEQYREAANQRARDEQAGSLASTVFSNSGITMDENQRGRLMGTLNDNDISAKNFAIGTRDAYNMGEQGATMEETVQAMGEKYGLSPKQARTAWSFGASNAQTTATGTADVSTEEGRTQVESALSFLGERTEDAVKLYDSRQDVGRMATAMNKAVLYAAHGADVQETVQNAREGKAADVVGVLTDEQARLAQEIGNEKRARQQAADKALGESYREMRQKAAAITGGATVSAQALEAVDTAIDATRKAGQRVMDEFNSLYNALEALEKADPNAKNSVVYHEMLDRAFKLRDKAQEAQKQIRELEKRKAQIEGRKTIQRKKGTVSFGGGTVEGVKYDGVDTAKLSRQQKKVVAMVERLADAVNLDYVFISADAGMGGAYTFGGRVYININAGLGVGNFSQTMAAASLSHEMTHWMQQYAPEEYSQLKDFIVQEILKADPQKLQKLIQQQKAWEKGRALTDEQAFDEVVANACQTMLMDSKAINKLARQNMSLAARIADWIADWSQKVKDAFAEVDTSQGAIYEAVRALDGSLDRIQELWDNGIENAAKNYNAQQLIGSEKAPIKEVPKPQMQEWKELEDEINNAGLNLKSKENNKNNVRINDYIAKNHPELRGKVVFQNDKQTGTVKILQVKTDEDVSKETARVNEEFQRQKNREAFWEKYHTQNAVSRLENQVAAMLKREGIDAFVEHSKSMVGSLSFYVKTEDGKTIKISDHNTVSQQFKYNDTAFINLHSVESLDDLYGKIRNALNSIADTAPESKAKMQIWSEAEEDYRQEQELETQIQEAEDALDFEDDEKVRRSLENRLVKLRADYDKLVAKERRLSKKTSIDEILNNLSSYRYNDLESIANQFSDGAWDIEPGTPREQLEEELREALEERAADMTPLQRQAPREGFFVRPAETRGQFQYIGESSETADKDALARARELDKQGVDNEAIRQQTGWFKGMDGKWRYEIPGNEMEWSDRWNPEKLGRRAMYVLKEQTELGELIKAPKLFKSYPELKNIRVNFVDDMPQGAVGEYNAEENRVLLRLEYAVDHPDKMLDTLAHEIQHVIQHIEGFTPGASPEYWANEIKHRTLQTASVEERGERKRVNQEYNQIRKDNPEFFDEASQLYRETPDEPLRSFGPVTKERIAPSPAWQEWQKKRDNLVKKWGRKAVDDFMLLSNKVIQFETPQTSRSPVDLYYNTAGEIEARDAAFRRNFVNDSQYKGIKPNLGNENTVFADRTQFQQWSDEEYEELTGSLDEDQLYSAITERKSEENRLREQIREMKAQEKEWVDKVSANEATLDDFQAWAEDSGYKAMLDRKDKLEKEIRMLYDRWEKARDNRLEREEQEALKKSGLSESEYFGKQAVKVFGYTPYYYDAGYIMSSGKMLNFSGEKGKHRGSRGQDHRAIGQIFATTQNSAAMTRFMNYGNIRIMGESPGIDISSKVEPTAEQYRQIKAFARNVADEEYFSVDLSDERGNNVGTLEYDGTIRPDRIINDIKHYYQTGEIRDAGLSAFYQRWDDTTDDTAAEANGREEAYTRLQSENKAVEDTIAALRKLTEKQGSTIERLRKRLRLTTTQEVREADARKLARNLVKEYGSGADVSGISEQLKALGDYVAQTKDLNADEVKNRAREIARGIVESASEQVSFEDETLTNIRGSIKGKKLTISPDFLGELDQENGFDAFRKRNFGAFTLARADSTSIDRSEYTSVSQFYTDLQSEYGKAYFPDLANEGEEIRTIAEFARAAAPMEVNPFEQYMGEATEELANQISMEVMDGALRLTPATDADKAKSRREALQERIRELQREGKIQEREAKDYERTIQELTDTLDKAQSRYRTLQVTAEQRMAQVRAEGRARQIEIKAKEREKAAENIKALKDHFRDMSRKARERRTNTATRRNIRKLIADLNNRLKHPTENKHIPRELMQITLDVLNMIDMDTGRGGTQAAQKLADIRALYESYKTNPTYQIAYDETTADMLDQLALTLRGTRLADMNELQLKAVHDTLKSLIHVIDTAVRIKIGTEEYNAYELSREMTMETRAVPKAQRGWLREHLIPAHLRADVAFRRFGGFKKNSKWEQAAKLLNDGQLKETRLKMELSRPFAEIFNDEKAMADFTGVNALGKVDTKKLVDIGLKDANGEAILVNHDLMVGIYMDLLNEDNRRHFINGGKTIPNIADFYSGKGGWGAGAQRSAGIAERLSELNRQLSEAERTNYGEWADDLKDQIAALKSEGEQYADKVQAAIESKLTDYDREWIAACKQLMDVDSKRELNRTTMDVYGIEKASVPDYWPITSDPDFLSKPMETVTKDMSLENVGFMKDRIKGANPSLALGTVNVVTRQIDRVSHYCGMMPALRSFGKIWNKTEAGYADSIKKATREVFQDSGVKYVENLIADLTGGRTIDRDILGLDAALGKLRGNLAQTSLTLNPRVAMAQAASYPTAAAELGWGPLAKALARGGKNGQIISRADTDLIAKWSPLLYHRMQGYSSPELGDIQSSTSASSKLWRKARWITGWIQAVDGATVGRLWYAAEYWVQDNKPTLQKGSDAYYEAVAEKFNAVVEKTQPNYTPMQRAAILREPSNLVKTFTMFMTQRLQNYNILYDAAGSYQKARADFANGRNGVTQADVSEARQNVARAVTSQLAQAAVYVGFKVLADALLHNMKKYRDKDTGDFTAESVSKAILDAYLEAWMGIEIFGSELYSIIKAVTGVSKWYGLSVSGVDSVNDLIENVVKLAQNDWSTDKGKENGKKTLLKVGTSLAQAFGIPLQNGIKLGEAMFNHITDAVNGEFFSFEAGYERTKKQEKAKEAVDAGVPKSLYLDTISEANTNGGTLAMDELGTYLQEAIPAGKLTEEQADIIWNVQGWSTDRAGWNAKAEKAAAKAQAITDLISPLGISQDEYDKIIDEANADGSSLTQDEFGTYLTEAIGSGKLTEEQANAIWKTRWNSAGSKTFDKWRGVQTESNTQQETQTQTPAATPKPTPQANLSGFESFKKSVSLYSDKKESAYQGWENEVKPLGVSLDSYVKIINAADAAGDGNGSVKQDEMGMQLVQKINRRELTYEQAEAIWHTIWSGARSKTFYKWYNG